MRRSKQELSAWARCSSRTRASFCYSRLGKTGSLGREWQFSPLLAHMQQRNSSNQDPTMHTTQLHSIKHTTQAYKHGTNQKHTKITLNW